MTRAFKQQANREVYLTRAAEAHSEAEEATLDNVRERCLRAEAAWTEMAARVERTEAMRESLEAAKAAAAPAEQDRPPSPETA